MEPETTLFKEDEPILDAISPDSESEDDSCAEEPIHQH